MGKAKRLLALALTGFMLLGVMPMQNARAAGDPEGGRSIETNLLSAYNTDFEGAGDNGNLYWWNDGNWDPIPRAAYGEDGRPSGGSGSYYMAVSSGGGQGTAQINNEDIAGILLPERTYEFTFYARARSGSGSVSLAANSHNSWQSMESANVTYDGGNDVTGDWRLISGELTMPANDGHKEVQIQLTGSQGLDFDVDDLRVGALSGGAETGENLVVNGDFAGEDLEVWSKGKGGAVIEAKTSDEPLGDSGVTTYGAISGREYNSDCFAQDMTGKVRSGGEYTYSFWVMLDAEDYKDAPEKKREVCFAPYVTAGSVTTYWGSYSTGVLDGGSAKILAPGVWTHFSGTFKPQYDGEATELTIRIIEQGPNYGAADNGGVRGRYYLTGVELREVPTQQKEIEWDIPNLKDSVSSAEGLGTDAYTGVSIVNTELTDRALMDLVEKHFNAVTFGNELKPDAIFGYQNDSSASLEFEELTWTRANGEQVTGRYPKMNFSLAKKMLDVLKEWNDGHPEDQIKIRGHVLTWHSQTPEWFFHQDWDSSKPYLTPEEMDVRQEWYIRGVMTELLGEESPYRDMFYGWDVVNEAVSDSTGAYRTDAEGSGWWAVYKSSDYIINAFRYANFYADKCGRGDLELYYNDYNECETGKVAGICALLRDVKAHEADSSLPTRITGMGMQAHHTVTSPTANQIRSAAVAYGSIVGKIQLTELDLKASNDYDGTEATRQSEYTRQAYRYKEIYDVLREVDAMEGIDVNGITIWGVIDGNSWLQDSSGVGGGSDGTRAQVPLLFDDDYRAKPAFWAFVDPQRLEPYIRSVVATQAPGGDDPYATGEEYTIDGAEASFKIAWDEGRLMVKVTVTDKTVEDSDGVRLYLDWTKSGTPDKYALSRAEAKGDGEGYTAEFTLDRDVKVGDSFLFDLVVTDGGREAAFNDLRMTQEESSKYFASARIKPYTAISSGTVTVDGEADEAWKNAKTVPLCVITGDPQASAGAKLLWDSEYLYVWVEVTDPALDKSNAETHQQDSVEVFIDENNGKTDGYEPDDKQYRINFDNEPSFNGEKCRAENMTSATKITGLGYIVEAAFRWTDITPAAGEEIGLELQINDGAGGVRIGTVSWYDESGQGWSSPAVFGTALLEKDSSAKPEKPSHGRPGAPAGPGAGSAAPTVPDEPEEPDEPAFDAAEKFSDVKEGDWYREAVSFAVSHGLMEGVGGGKFDPKGTATRGMVMTILARMKGVDTSGGATWYEKGMNWAVEKGVSDGTAPEAAIDREQLVTMLWRLMEEPEAGPEALDRFPDAPSVSSWARAAMAWAVETGLIKGGDSGIMPGAPASRAEIAQILIRFVK